MGNIAERSTLYNLNVPGMAEARYRGGRTGVRNRGMVRGGMLERGEMVAVRCARNHVLVNGLSMEYPITGPRSSPRAMGTRLAIRWCLPGVPGLRLRGRGTRFLKGVHGGVGARRSASISAGPIRWPCSHRRPGQLRRS
jgi:hypothetical protein